MKKTRTFKSMAITLAILLGLTPLLTFGQDLEVIQHPVTMDIQSEFGFNTNKFMNDARAQKIGIGLLSALEMHGQGKDFTDNQTVRVEGDKILIQAFANSVEEAEGLLSSLTEMGMTNGAVHKHIINGMLPFDKVEGTAGLAALRSISIAINPKVRVGDVTSQGDQAMQSDQVKTLAGVDGSGRKIGILSDAYNSFGTAPAGVASGDLPGPGNPNGYTTPVQILSDPFFGIDEGRGMAELIHDVAPGSELAFHTAFGGFADFANGIIELRQAGCDIIVDDVFYFAQPYFQDDIIGQAANAVVDDGALYFSSAGNSGNSSYDEGFSPGGFLFDFGFGLVYEPHDWGGGDYFYQVTIPPGEVMDFWLQWDEPSLLAGLVGPSMDLDIIVLTEDLSSIYDVSLLCNTFEGVPLEFIRTGNFGATPLVLNIMVGRWAPVPGNPSRIKFIDFGDSNAGDRYQNPGEVIKGTVVGHPNTAGAIGVGAAAYFNTPEFGVSPALANIFSSIGGVPILFDPAGNRLSEPHDRFKPDFVGPDGGNTTFFGQDVEPDGFPNFFGTSASAPHVAALSALLSEAVPDASNKTIEGILKETAMDMDDRRGVHTNLRDSNFDYATGYGFVRGVAALQAIKAIPTLSQWGILLFILLITSLGLATIYSVKFAPAVSTGQLTTRPGFKLFFDRNIFYQKLPQGVMAIALGAVIIMIFWGEILAQDIVGLAMTLPLVTYILHLVEVMKGEE